MKPKRTIFKGMSLFIGVCFFFQTIFPSFSFAQELLLPKPTEFVYLSSSYSFPVLKGMKFDPADPLKMEFIIDTGDDKVVARDEAEKLVKYFLAGLTIPEEDLWVNMSPYEEDRIIPEKLSETDLGRDLLAQDYILKQLSSSLVYPESDTGKDYWKRVYEEVLKIAKTTKLPVNTFNKIWITPEKAVVYENESSCLITEASLKVMLEEDYLALSENSKIKPQNSVSSTLNQEIHKASSQVMKDTILPKIARDVNYGKNFANLRQIYHSLILACWFKKKFKESIYKHYIDQGKITGIDLEDKDVKEKIYSLYTQAFKNGLYNYIKTESEPKTKKRIKRKYFGGGTAFMEMNTQFLSFSSLSEFYLEDCHAKNRAKLVVTMEGLTGGIANSPIESALDFLGLTGSKYFFEEFQRVLNTYSDEIKTYPRLILEIHVDYEERILEIERIGGRKVNEKDETISAWGDILIPAIRIVPSKDIVFLSEDIIFLHNVEAVLRKLTKEVAFIIEVKLPSNFDFEKGEELSHQLFNIINEVICDLCDQKKFEVIVDKKMGLPTIKVSFPDNTVSSALKQHPLDLGPGGIDLGRIEDIVGTQFASSPLALSPEWEERFKTSFYGFRIDRFEINPLGSSEIYQFFKIPPPLPLKTE